MLSPVLLITDIERGGAFASIVGTMELIEKKYVELVQGFIINKFRGDVEILKPGYKKLQQKTGLPVLGTIPMTKFEIPDEDSLGNSSKTLNWNSSNLKKLDKEINKISKIVKSLKKYNGIICVPTLQPTSNTSFCGHALKIRKTLLIKYFFYILQLE